MLKFFLIKMKNILTELLKESMLKMNYKLN